MDPIIHILMKRNVNPVALINETTEAESQTSFISALLTYFREFPE